MKSFLHVILAVVLLSATAVTGDFLYHGSFLWNDIRAMVQSGDFLFCAFYDGVGAVNLALDFNKKKLYSTCEISGNPRRVRLSDSLLVVETETGAVSLVDVSDPAHMTLLGTLTPGRELLDFQILGNFLYAAVEYDGLIRYDISDPGDIHFDDSSMVGISVTALVAYQSRLFVLDSYNGVLIYEPGADDIGLPVAALLLPHQAVSLSVANDTVYAGLRPTGYMVGSVTDVYHPRYVGDRESFIRGDQIAATSQGVALANSVNGFELIYGTDGSVTHRLFPLSGIRGYSEVYFFGGSEYIAYPHREHGFVAYNIDDPSLIDIAYPDLVYASPGPITQLAFMRGRLHTIGVNNWYEQYDVTDPGRPLRTGKMINPPYQPAGVCVKGDTLFVADRETNSIFSAIDIGRGDPVSIVPIIAVTDSIDRPYLIPDYFSDGDLLYFHNEHRFNGTSRNDSIFAPNLIRWSFPTGITAVMVNGPILYQGDGKGVLVTYTIDDHFALTETSRINVSGQVSQMIKVGSLLYLGAGDLAVASLAEPRAPEIIERVIGTGQVYEMQLVGQWLLCAAKNGVYAFDISSVKPQQVLFEPVEAIHLAFVNHLLAVSNGHSVQLFTVPIVEADDETPALARWDAPRLTGHPNPFNPSVTLVMEHFDLVPEPVVIEVFDILGRHIQQLAPLESGGGRWTAFWDGRDEEGRAAASGVYLFQAKQGTRQAVFKGILLK
jgi:hypothetical protein